MSYLGYIALAQIWKVQYLSNLIIQIHTFFFCMSNEEKCLYLSTARLDCGLEVDWKRTGSGLEVET